MSAVVNCAAYADGRQVADVQIKDIREVLSRPRRTRRDSAPGRSPERGGTAAGR